jgi:hypothetical protein
LSRTTSTRPGSSCTPGIPTRNALEDYDAARCAALVRRAIGTDAYPFTIRTISPWTMTAQVAERYRGGRASLIGDAAHRFPPTGGLGLNTGVQDAHNLAWKLRAVEAGWSAAALLDTYETERRPVAQRNADVSVAQRDALLKSSRWGAEGAARMRSAASADGRAHVAAAIANQAEHFDMLGLQLGFAYEPRRAVDDGSTPPARRTRARLRADGASRARLPHAWIGTRSTLDLIRYDRFTLITGRPAGVGDGGRRRIEACRSRMSRSGATSTRGWRQSRRSIRTAPSSFARSTRRMARARAAADASRPAKGAHPHSRTLKEPTWISDSPAARRLSARRAAASAKPARVPWRRKGSPS